MKTNVFISILAILFFAACSNADKVAIDNSNIDFFDFKAFFEKEIKDFSFKKIKKTVTLNDETETQELTEFDMEKELNLFIKANISRPSWKDKYQVTQSGNQTTYKAMDEELTIREIILEKEGGEVTQITIHTLSDNTIFEAAKTMIYQPKKGFSIENKQDVMLAGKNNIRIEVEFLK
jgi:hypothetical protein